MTTGTEGIGIVGARPTTWVRWLTIPRVLAAVVPAVLVVLALSPLYAAYGHPTMWVTVGAGTVVGTVLAVVGARRRWATLTVLAFALPIFFLLGALAVPTSTLGGVLPTLTTWRLMGQGVVTVWMQVLTIAPPLGRTGALLLLPYLLSFFGAIIAVTISLRATRWSLSLLVPVVLAVAAILFGTADSVSPIVLGVVGTAIATAWVAWRAGRLELHRVIAVPLVFGLMAVGGTGSALLLAPENPRFVLRDLVDPPPDPHDYPSPLSSYRDYVDDLADEEVLTINGLPGTTERVRLATMDSYDGHVWGVAGSGADSGTFARVGERLVSERSEDAMNLGVQIGSYDGVWVPTIGASEDVDFAGERADVLRDSLYFNRETDTGLADVGLAEGDRYSLVAAPEADVVDDPDAAPDEALLELPVESVQLPEPTAVPEALAALAVEYTAGANADYERVSMIATSLRTYGFFSNGLEGEAPSRPGHGAQRLSAMLTAEEMTGNAEQYASAMALMVRTLGLPARVVMGFEIPEGGSASGSVTVTGADVTAWVEVPFEGRGWLPFFPTPEEDQIPQVLEPTPQDRPEPQVLQPPEPPAEPPIVPPLDRSDAPAEQDPPEEDGAASRALFYVMVIGIPILVLVMPFLLIVAIKAWRWRRRRTRGPASRRFAGGWAELADRALDLGVEPSRGATRLEASAMFDRELAGSTTLLARRADEGVFAPDVPGEVSLGAYWADVRTAVKDAGRASGLRRRVRARFSLRSLRHRKRRR